MDTFSIVFLSLSILFAIGLVLLFLKLSKTEQQLKEAESVW